MITRRKIFYLIPALCLLAALGCSTAHQKELLAQRKSALELKKKNYAALSRQVLDNSLEPGTLATTIQEKFGKPESVFHSGSMDSTFDIWTYEKEMEKGEEDWNPIRLYFNDGKLVSWKY